MSIDVLAIFAHPDDAELTVGGTLLKMKSFGYKTAILDVTRGENGTRGTVEMRLREAEEAAKILKVDVRENLEMPDGAVFVNDEQRKAMVRVIRRLAPKIILTHQIDDPHPDHHQIALLARDAARLSSMQKFDSENGQPRISVPMVAHNIFSRNVLPSFIVDVTEFAKIKMDAIRAHSSQFFTEDSNELETRISSSTFLDELENRMKYFGSLIGAAAGEPFYVREALNVVDPVALLTRPMNLYS